MYLRPKYVRGQYTTPYSFDRTQTPTADTYSWRAASRARAAEGLGRASPFKRRQRSRTHRRARACCRLLSSSFATMRMPYQCVRTCPGARGWGEAWAVGAVPSSCTEMAPHVVVVCSTCMRWCAARAWQPWPAAGDGWNVSIMVAEELPHLIQPVAEALTADTSLVSKRTRQCVCAMSGSKSRWYLVHSSGEHTVAQGR